jgi:hypothetical protein
MRTLTALVIALSTASFATACINDRELPSHEREFRSQYQEVELQPASAEPETANLTKYFIGGAVSAGLVLAVVGGVFILRVRGAQH